MFNLEHWQPGTTFNRFGFSGIFGENFALKIIRPNYDPMSSVSNYDPRWGGPTVKVWGN